MKSCVGCIHAEWERTKAGRLHPSGDGMCTYEIKMPVIPNAFHWVFGPPSPIGGYINRKREYKNNCPLYMPPKENAR